MFGYNEPNCRVDWGTVEKQQVESIKPALAHKGYD